MRQVFKLLAIVGCTLVTTAVSAQTTLRMWNTHPEGYPVTLALESFAADIASKTQGRYKVDLYNKAVLGDQPKAVSMVKSGELDLAEFSSAPLAEGAPGIKALNLPFLFRDSAHMFRHLDGKLGDGFAEKLKTSGFIVLGWYDGGARSFYCSNKPINSINDLKGSKIRIQQSEVYIEIIKQLEAQSLAVPFTEVYAAFESKKIDCAENNMPSYESTGHYKLAKYVYLTNHVISPEALVMSTKMWDKLSAQDRAVFKETGLASALKMRALWQERVKLSIDKTTKAGSQFVLMKDGANMIRRLGPLYGKYMSDATTRGEVLTIIADQN